MAPIQLLDLPPPRNEKKGWPWTESSVGIYKSADEVLEWPRISIITPSFNQGEFIEETIRSILLQNYPNFEYFVVDGVSTDDTIVTLNKYEKYLSWISESDEGQTDAINKGLKRATGDIIAYMNSDDIYLPGTFYKIAEFFKQNPDVDMVYGNVVHINKKSDIYEYPKTEQVTLEKIFTFNIYIPQPTVFLRKSLIEDIGFFDKNLHLAMDYDYWIRVIPNHKIIYFKEFLAGARIYPEAKSSSLDCEYKDEFLYIIEKFFSIYSEKEIGISMNKVKSMVYLNAARISLMKLLMDTSRQYFLISFKLYPRNFFNLSAIGGWALAFCGTNIAQYIINVRNRLVHSKFRKTYSR
jgi:glycosyltransferase involved in cell wall biosynthesis